MSDKQLSICGIKVLERDWMPEGMAMIVTPPIVIALTNARTGEVTYSKPMWPPPPAPPVPPVPGSGQAMPPAPPVG